jgi:hypothetical protein
LNEIEAETGGFVSMDNKYVGLKFVNSKISKIKAPIRGGILDIQEASVIFMERSEFRDF